MQNIAPGLGLSPGDSALYSEWPWGTDCLIRSFHAKETKFRCGTSVCRFPKPLNHWRRLYKSPCPAKWRLSETCPTSKIRASFSLPSARSWHGTAHGLTLMAFGFMLERFWFVYTLCCSGYIPGQIGRDLSFWIGIAFITLALLVIGFSIVQYRCIVKTMKPIEIPENYSIWAGTAMNVAVVVLGIVLVAYLFSEL